MAWDDWQYIHLHCAPDRPEAVLGYVHDMPKGALRLLVNDDTDVPTEQAAEKFCRNYLGVNCKGRDDDCPTERPVYVYFTESFDLAKRLTKEKYAQTFAFDGVLQDIIHDESGELTGLNNIHRIRQGVITPQPAVLIVTNDSTLAVGAREKHPTPTLFAISKDPDPEHRVAPEKREIENYFRAVEENRDLSDNPLFEEFRCIIGRTTQTLIQEFLGFLDDDREDRIPVVIQGKSGTGKEAVARLIHLHDRYSTDRKFERFQPVLVASIPSGTLQGELFGVVSLSPRDYGANDARPIEGYIAKAAHGTLFIDEVGDVPPFVQGGLLRFLQEHKIRPVGGEWQDVPDVRCVFATHKNLRNPDEVEMREDFLHRIDGLTIDLPDLKDRTDEHEALLDYFIGCSRAAEKAGMDAPFSDELRERIIKLCRSGALTGNVRQLKMLVNRIVRVAAGGRQIGESDFKKALKYSLINPDKQ